MDALLTGDTLADKQSLKGQARALAHYGAAMITTSVYGAEVCPLVESLSKPEQVFPILAALSITFALRFLFWGRVITLAPFGVQTKRVFCFDGGLFVGAGILLIVYNAALYDFPLAESGLKLLIGFMALGFFAAIDLSLEHERRILEHFRATGEQLVFEGRFFPVSRKVGMFASVGIAFTLVVFFLLTTKDLDWLSTVGSEVSFADAKRIILVEFAFVIGVFLLHILNIIRSFSINLNTFFVSQTHAMEETTRGRLDSWVPVSTNDEFGRIALHTNLMVEGIRDRTNELVETQDVTIMALASLAETRDNETGAHIIRTQWYVRALAAHLAKDPRFKTVLTPENVNLMFKSAPLHDIGKVGIPDSILLKPGSLTEEEFEIMKTHTILGAEALRVAEEQKGSSSFLRFAREIAGTHHEKWDGSGYPNGLSGEDIPLSGRFMAVADVYDALISKRVYKEAFSHEKALGIIAEGKGSHFDPVVVDALLEVESEFREIAARHQDTSSTEKVAEKISA